LISGLERLFRILGQVMMNMRCLDGNLLVLDNGEKGFGLGCQGFRKSLDLLVKKSGVELLVLLGIVEVLEISRIHS
jgi:hypothetical protein